MRVTMVLVATGLLGVSLACGGTGSPRSAEGAQQPTPPSADNAVKADTVEVPERPAWFDAPGPTPRSDDYVSGEVDALELLGWTAGGRQVIVRSALRASYTGDFDGYEEDEYLVVQFLGPDGSHERAFASTWSDPAATLLEPEVTRDEAVRRMRAASYAVPEPGGELVLLWDGEVQSWGDTGARVHVTSTAAPARVQLLLRRDEGVRVLDERIVEGNYGGASTFHVQALWHPERPVVALLLGEVHGPHQLSRGSDRREVRFVRLDPVEVQVVMSRGTPPELLAELPSAFREVSRTPARKDRTSTVIYAGPGFEGSAWELAAAVRGEVDVEPLTWRAEGGAPLVLALGE